MAETLVSPGLPIPFANLAAPRLEPTAKLVAFLGLGLPVGGRLLRRRFVLLLSLWLRLALLLARNVRTGRATIYWSISFDSGEVIREFL